ncbi:hypothetical protein HPB50_007058 [Hyalomma asiaticum]|uniref:Uncharacterized protein n=1 Tax=Hyalomma asiaticum TaxID=266040 RepID=A0ACB7SNH0_HYAAI|nr:hypothetical protein HPB50_007058 [Hyalomma asiaticum]
MPPVCLPEQRRRSSGSVDLPGQQKRIAEEPVSLCTFALGSCFHRVIADRIVVLRRAPFWTSLLVWVVASFIRFLSPLPLFQTPSRALIRAATTSNPTT